MCDGKGQKHCRRQLNAVAKVPFFILFNICTQHKLRDITLCTKGWKEKRLGNIGTFDVLTYDICLLGRVLPNFNPVKSIIVDFHLTTIQFKVGC